MKKFLWILALSIVCVKPAYGAVNLVDKDDWKVDMSGFVETDLFYDTTKSFTEVIGNNPVNLPNGQKGRTQMSIRNSRLAFNVQAPTVNDWKSRGYFEFDLLGYDPSAGNGPPSQSEAAFFNNPTMRVRHAYAEVSNDGWQFLTGQTWELMGWQPYYFIPTIQVAPIGGMLYNRTVQMRGMKTLDLSDSQFMQFAVSISRPPQRDAQLPSLEAGVRWADKAWTGAFTGGATGSHTPQPLSVGISGTVRDYEIYNQAGQTSTSSHTGDAVAIDFLAPILPSSDGKDSSNNVVLGGEYTIGSGYGDEMNSWTGGQFQPSSGGASPYSLNNLDAGIGGFDGNNAFSLIQLQSMNIYAQYHLPESMHMWVSAGWSQLYSPNMGQMVGGLKGTAYDKETTYFANVSHDCTKQLRIGFEYANVQTHYVTGVEPQDNRFQYSTWFMF